MTYYLLSPYTPPPLELAPSETFGISSPLTPTYYLNSQTVHYLQLFIIFIATIGAKIMNEFGGLEF